MAVPQPLQVQLPSTRGLSLEAEPPLAGADCARLLLWQSRQVNPFVLRGSNGNSVIAAPHPLHVQFP